MTFFSLRSSAIVVSSKAVRAVTTGSQEIPTYLVAVHQYTTTQIELWLNADRYQVLNPVIRPYVAVYACTQFRLLKKLFCTYVHFTSSKSTVLHVLEYIFCWYRAYECVMHPGRRVCLWCLAVRPTWVNCSRLSTRPVCETCTNIL
jgi:hypothetical protein